MEKSVWPRPAPTTHSELLSPPPLCRHCQRGAVEALIRKTDVIWWWCAGCGHIWGQLQTRREQSGKPD